MAFLVLVCIFTQLKSVYIVIKSIVHYNHQRQLLARALYIKDFFNPFDVKSTCVYFNSGNFINRLSHSLWVLVLMMSSMYMN